MQEDEGGDYYRSSSGIIPVRWTAPEGKSMPVAPSPLYPLYNAQVWRQFILHCVCVFEGPSTGYGVHVKTTLRPQ